MRRTSIGLAILAVLVLPFSAQAAPEINSTRMRRAMRLTEKGEKAIRTGNFSKASVAFRQALEQVPELPDAHLGLGHVAMRERHFEDALAEYRRAEEGYGVLGQALFKEEVRRFNSAKEQIQEDKVLINELQRQLSNPRNDANPRIRTHISRLEQEIRQLEGIDPPRDDAVDRTPAEVYFFIGNALGNLDRYEEAAAAWEACVNKKPGFAPVHNNLAVAYWKLRRLEEARASLAKAEELGLAVNPKFKAELERALAIGAAGEP